jgi:hypothetical protein
MTDGGGERTPAAGVSPAAGSEPMKWIDTP